jgi:general secretion pathway protein H
MASSEARIPETLASAEAGFTLIEMTCALAIVALIAAVALPALPRATSGPRLEAYAVETAALLIGDRNAAIRRGAPVVTRLDGRSRAIRSGVGDAIVIFPVDVAFDALVADACDGRPARDSIEFFANGMSCGGAIFIGRGDVRFEIRVNWLTGVVEVRHAAAKI